MVKVPEKSGYILSLFQYQPSGKKDLAVQTFVMEVNHFLPMKTILNEWDTIPYKEAGMQWERDDAGDQEITNVHYAWLLTNDVTLPSYPTSLSLSFLICKIMIIIPTLPDYCEYKIR